MEAWGIQNKYLSIQNQTRITSYNVCYTKLLRGTTTSKNKLALLRDEKIEAYFLKITQKEILGNVNESLTGSDVLVLNIPPGLRKNPEQDYVAQIKILIPYIEASKIKRVLFISSTSVYSEEESFPESYNFV